MPQQTTINPPQRPRTAVLTDATGVNAVTTDGNGNLNVNVQAGGGGGGSNPAAAPTGAPVPVDADYIGAKDSLGNLIGLSTDGSGNLNVNLAAGTITGGNAAASATGAGVPASADYTGYNKAGNLVGVSSTNPLPVDGSGVTQPISGSVAVSNFPATQPVSGSVSVSNFPATQPVSGTVAVSSVGGTVTVDASGHTVPISAATLPLPSGAATDNTVANVQVAIAATTAPTKIDIIGGKTSDVTAQYQPLPLTNGGAAVKIDGSTTTQPISGSVSVSNFPATQAVSGTVTDNQGNPAAIANAWPIKVTDGTNAATIASLTNSKALAVEIVDGAGTQITSFGGGTQFADNAASGATPTGTLNMGWDSANSKVRALKVDASQNLDVNVQTGSVSVSNFPGTQAISGTVTTTPPSNASTNVAQVAGTTTDTNSGLKSAGTLRVVLATDQPALTNKLLVTPDSVALPANQSVNVSQINAVTPLMGNGITGTGSQRVTIASDNTAFAVNATLSAETTKVIGTVNVAASQTIAVTQATAANLNATVSGTVTSNQGTANTAANAWTAKITDGTNTAAVKAASTAAAATDPALVVAVSPNNSVAVTQATAASLNATAVLAAGTATIGSVKITDGTTVATVIAGTTALKTDLSSVAGTATVTAVAGVMKVGVVGNAGATVDSTAAAGTAPTNAVLGSHIFNTTIPAPTAGQAVAQQCDSTGALAVNIEGRKTTYSAATGATATAGTGVVLQIQGSSTKTVRITRIHVTGFAATAAQATFKIQRTSVAATAGTSAALTAGKADINDATATAVVTHWTATGGTTGTTVGGPYLSESAWLPSSTFAAAVGSEGDRGWLFGEGNSKQMVLRGTADFITLTCSGTLAASQVWVEWTEE